ncbi:MAG: SIS domain-containing protein [Thermoplasmata archaeon]
MTDTLPDQRKGHPYVMYDMMRDIPNGIERTIRSMEKSDMDFLGDNMIFTGNGTAYHSAIIGAQILDQYGRKWSAIQAYEILMYRKISSLVIGVSHTGKTKSTVDAIIKAGKTAKTVGITHFKDSPLAKESDFPIVIEDEDKSLCNTKAFFNNAFASLYISSQYANINVDFSNLKTLIDKHVRDDDAEIKSIAPDFRDTNSIFVLGSGPNFAAAREGAQKIKEATHIHAEGIELEEFNHGCTSVIDDRSLLIIISNKTNVERTNQIVKASRYVGTKTLVINGDGDYSFYNEDIDEYYSPFLNMIPMYYFAYYLAVARGINPDYLRFEDDRYRKYDDTVFPPGAH